MQMQAYTIKTKDEHGEHYTLTKKNADDEGATYVSLKDASVYLTIPQSALRKNLGSAVYHPSKEQRDAYEFDSPLAVVDGKGFIDIGSYDVYVLLDYLIQRKKLRDEERLNVVSVWDVQRAVRERDLKMIEESCVSTYKARQDLPKLGHSLGDTSEIETHSFPLDPHSATVVPAKIIADKLSRLPKARLSVGNFAYSLLNKRSIPHHVSINATMLYEVGAITSDLLASVALSDLSEVHGRNVIVRPSDLVQIAGGVTFLQAMLRRDLKSGENDGKVISRIKRRHEFLADSGRRQEAAEVLDRIARVDLIVPLPNKDNTDTK